MFPDLPLDDPDREFLGSPTLPSDGKASAWARTSGMFKFLGHFTTAHPRAICLTWLVVGVALTLVAPRWDSRAIDDDIHFLPDRCPSVRGYRLLEQAFPKDVFA